MRRFTATGSSRAAALILRKLRYLGCVHDTQRWRGSPESLTRRGHTANSSLWEHRIGTDTAGDVLRYALAAITLERVMASSGQAVTHRPQVRHALALGV